MFLFYLRHFSFILFLLPGLLLAQKTNRLNKNGQRTGKWVVYQDSAKSKKLTDVRYRNGNAVGRAYYYTPEGDLERREISRFKRLKTTLYYPDKTIRMRGLARIENKTDRIHYYFYGKWKYYDEKGKLIKYGYYEKGKLVKTVYLNKTNFLNDSLAQVLFKMDTLFQKNNVALLNKIGASRFDIVKNERLREELYASDTLHFQQLERLLAQHGYPAKKEVQEAVIIPFFILSYAPTPVKEKYLEMLKQAADRGDLEWATLAYFIDKIKIAKGEKQTYGTQYYSEDNKNRMYPVDDADNLEKRRKEVGLDTY